MNITSIYNPNVLQCFICLADLSDGNSIHTLTCENDHSNDVFLLCPKCLDFMARFHAAGRKNH